MSFIDPDLREQWAKESQERRDQCRKQTDGKHAFGTSDGVCRYCGANDPNPRVTLQTPTFRAVYQPKTGDVIIEQRSTDTLGADRWDRIDALPATQSRSEKSHHHIIELLVRGVKP